MSKLKRNRHSGEFKAKVACAEMRLEAMISEMATKYAISEHPQVAGCGTTRHWGELSLNLTSMRLIDEQFLQTPYYGARQMARGIG